MHLSALTIPALYLPLTSSNPVPQSNSLQGINSYISLGDSYASGPGSGPLRNSTCLRHALSYPLQLHSFLSLFQPISHTHIPCTGTTTSSFLATQLPLFTTATDTDTDSTTPDIATLSLGGNDAGFWAVIDACVYRFGWPYVHPPFDPSDPSNPGGKRAFTGDCETELLATISEIHSIIGPALENVYWRLLEVGVAGNEGFRLYVTGYPRLFNEETGQCDNVAFNYWSFDLRKRYLTKERRRKINYVVKLLGHKIQEAVAKVNDEWTISRKGNKKRIIYIDIDPYFSAHRFCEPGVIEPEYSLQKGAWFFNTYTEEATSLINTTSDFEHLAGNKNRSEITQEVVASHPLDPLDEGWNKNESENENDVQAKGKGKGKGKGVKADWVPSSWLRVFHPTPDGHAAIARAVLEAIYSSSSPPSASSMSPSALSLSIDSRPSEESRFFGELR